jgi:hypothetical protein
MDKGEKKTSNDLENWKRQIGGKSRHVWNAAIYNGSEMMAAA